MLKSFDARPDVVRATNLACEMDRSLLNTLSYLTGVAEETLDEPFHDITRAIDECVVHVGSGQRLRGIIYSVNAELEQAMKDGDVSRVRELLAYLESTQFVRSRDQPEIHGLGSGFWTLLEEQAFLGAMEREFRSTYGQAFGVHAPSNKEISRSAPKVGKALEVLREVDSELCAEVQCLISDALIVGSSQIHAGSSFKAYGIAYLRQLESEQHWTAYLEHLVHEAAHMFLFSVWKQDAVVINDGIALYRSPLRPEPRPMGAVFHAMFVLARILRIERRLERHPYYGVEKPNWVASYNQAGNQASVATKFVDAFRVVMDEGELTPAGHSLALSAEEMAFE